MSGRWMRAVGEAAAQEVFAGEIRAPRGGGGRKIGQQRTGKDKLTNSGVKVSFCISSAHIFARTSFSILPPLSGLVLITITERENECCK